jgi:hypothetical protein
MPAAADAAIGVIVFPLNNAPVQIINIGNNSYKMNWNPATPLEPDKGISFAQC